MKNQIFEYNGTPVTFQLGNGDVMVSATQMAKPFKKRPTNWLDLPSTSQFIDTLKAVRKSDRSNLVNTVNGVGTWFHEDVAIEFARWLSPAFAIWCNDRIKELMQHGVTATPQAIDSILSDPDNAIKLLTALKEERTQREILEQQNELHKQQIEMAEPKVQYYNDVLASGSVYTTNRIAKEFGMSAVTLNRKLREMGVQYNQGGQWLLTCKYQNKGYTKTRTYTYLRNDGSTETSLQTVWTERGREFIHKLLSNTKTA